MVPSSNVSMEEVFSCKIPEIIYIQFESLLQFYLFNNILFVFFPFVIPRHYFNIPPPSIPIWSPFRRNSSTHFLNSTLDYSFFSQSVYLSICSRKIRLRLVVLPDTDVSEPYKVLPVIHTPWMSLLTPFTTLHSGPRFLPSRSQSSPIK